MLTHHKAIVRLGIPIAIGQIGLIIMGFADTMMVGRYGTDSLAASSFVNNVFNLVTFLIIGYSYGLTPLISALFGQGKREEAGATFRHAFLANMSFTILLVVLMSVLYFFVDCLGQPAEIMPLVRPYYLCALISMLFVGLFNVERQFTDALTNTSVAMWTLLVGNALNIIGNYFLIYGIGPFPELGLLGAGLSTLFSRIVMALILCYIIFTRPAYAVYRKGMRAAGTRLCDLLYINKQSLPVSLQMGMETCAFNFSAIMAGWIGAVDLATFQVVNTIGTLGFMLYYSFGSGMSIRIASFFGLKDYSRAKEASRAGTQILVTMTIGACLTFFFFGEYLIRAFTTDAAVVALSMSLIPLLMLYQLGDAMQICFSNALRATAKVSSVMGIAFVSYLVINIPFGYILGFNFGLGIHGIYFAFSLGLFTAAALFFRQYRKVMRSCDA